MKRLLTVIYLFVATLFWVVIPVIPHHHHNGALVFISFDATHSDCHHTPCDNSGDDKCCNNSNCENCPFSERNDSIIKKGYDNNDSDVKLILLELSEIYNYKYDFISHKSIRLYYRDDISETYTHTQCSLLRAPPFA